MKRLFCALAMASCLIGAAHAESPASAPALSPSPAPHAGRTSTQMRVAQQCGFFAILGCYEDKEPALEWNSKIEYGHVINTSSDRYPNFRPGFYCVVHGPTSKREATHIRNEWRSVINDAYVKSSC